jgi:hypothetical protein
MSQSKILPPQPTRYLARLTFVAFLFTFIASRTLVILIMARRMPDLFLHLGGTHVHHLNYGIFLLSAVAGVLLFARLNDKQRSVCALAYGIGMALTFDEFGMWLHLGGSYWQRASFDAVIVLLSVFGFCPAGNGSAYIIISSAGCCLRQSRSFICCSSNRLLTRTTNSCRA